MANSSNITLRLAINGGTDTSLTYEQLDGNFLEVIDLIDDYNAHIISTAAHDAIDIPFDNNYASSEYTSTNVQDALKEIESDRRATQDKLDAHEVDTTAHPSSNITYDNTSSGLAANEMQGALDELDGNLDSHIGSSTAHDADSIVYDNVSSGLAATNTQQAIDEHVNSATAHGAVDIEYDNTNTDLTSTDTQSAIDEHVNSATAHDAVDIEYDAADSSLSSSNVKTALDELDTDLNDHINSTSAHDAVDIVYNNANTNLTSVDVQGAIDEHVNSTTSHAASDITFDNTTSGLSATDTQDAIDELDGNLDSHIGSSTAHDAVDIVYDASGSSLSSTTTKDAIDELDTDLNDHISSTTAHDADDITYTDVTEDVYIDNANSVGDILRIIDRVIYTHHGQMSITGNSTVIPAYASDSGFTTNLEEIPDSMINEDQDNGVNTISETGGTVRFQITRQGVYRLDFWATVTTSTDNTYVAFKYRNDTTLSNRKWMGRVPTAGNKINIAGHTYTNFFQNNSIQVEVAADTACDITIEDMAFSITEIQADTSITV